MDKLIRRPKFARSILAVGAAVFFVACIPSYGQRGYPRLDPFWDAMIWLWIPPIAISAIYDCVRGRRYLALGNYVLVCSFIINWATFSMVPNRKGPLEALLEVPLTVIPLLVGVLVVEWVSQGVLAGFRSFLPSLACQQCGYCLRGLREPRCPECGTRFEPELLDPSYQPRPTPLFKRVTTYLALLILLVAAAWPQFYRARTLHSLQIRGQQQAQEDWANREAKFYVTRDEESAMSPEQLERYNNLVLRQDPRSGLEIRFAYGGPQELAWQTSYRDTIERKLRESGQSRPFD